MSGFQVLALCLSMQGLSGVIAGAIMDNFPLRLAGYLIFGAAYWVLSW